MANLMAWGDVEPRRMFGCDAYLVGGRLCAFFADDGVVVKVPSPQREELLNDPRVSPFTTGRGRGTFGEWLHLRLGEALGIGGYPSLVLMLTDNYYLISPGYRSVEELRRAINTVYEHHEIGFTRPENGIYS